MIAHHTCSCLILGLLALASWPGECRAEEDVRARLDWAELARAGRAPRGEVVAGDLVVRGGGGVLLLELPEPPITTGRYALRATVTAEGVAGQAMFEMWSYFEDGAYFTRTLGTGAMAPLSGTEGPRPLMLPFDAQSARAPLRLVLNLHGPAEGTVRISALELVQYPSAAALWAALGESGGATGRLVGWVGGIYGSLLGGLGAILGALVQLGRGRRVAAALIWGTVGLSALAAVAAPLVTPGTPGLVLALVFAGGALLMGGVGHNARRRFEAAELRRMQALDTPLR